VRRIPAENGYAVQVLLRTIWLLHRLPLSSLAWKRKSIMHYHAMLVLASAEMLVASLRRDC